MRSVSIRNLVAATRLSGLSWSGLSASSIVRVGVGALTAVLVAGTGWSQGPATGHAAVSAGYGKLPLSFEANEGQSDARVKFLSHGDGYSLFLTDNGAVLSLRKGDGRVKNPMSQNRDMGHSDRSRADLVRMELVGAGKAANVSGAEKLPGTANYFIGNDPNQWHADVPTYARVKYAGVYPGVDLVYYGNQRQLEYDFVLAPGADAKKVRVRFAGAEKLRLGANGDLSVVASHGQVAFDKPVVYQLVDGKRVSVDGRFTLMAKNEVGFVLGKYDRTRELVIDPTLTYSTYLGGTTEDAALGVTADASGNAYVTGYTLSTNFPTTSSAFQKTSSFITNASQSAIFVTKLNASGSALVYSTYLSGTESHCTAGANADSPVLDGDFGTGIAVDASGDAYVTGGTCANDFPVTKGAFQATYPSEHHADNAFITKLNPTGSALIYSTYLGGEGSGPSGDWGTGIAVDASGDAYVTGSTWSDNFPTTTGAYQASDPSGDGVSKAFVTKMNATGTALVYSTYLGSSGSGGPGGYRAAGQAIAINASGNAYVTGFSYSNNFPVTGSAYQTINKAYADSGANAFVTEMNTTGTGLVFSTYIGGSGKGGATNLEDPGNAIVVDASGDVYIAGYSHSTDYPVTTGAYQTKFSEGAGEGIGFVSKLNSTGTGLVYSTFLGGSGVTACGGDWIYGLDVDGFGDALVTGFACSNNFPVTSGAYQTGNSGKANLASNAFLTELNPTGSGLLYSTYIGGSGTTTAGSGDVGYGLAYLDGSVYLAGVTNSTNFPVSSGAYQKTNKATAGNTTAFVAKFAFATASTTTLVTDATPEKVGVKVTFTADVTGAEGSGTPTGTVNFSVDGGAAVAETLDDTGHAAYSTTTLAEGVHQVVASYLGDATHLASTSETVTETIYGAASTETIVSGSPQTVVVGASSAPLVVLVKDAKGDVVPGVVVTFSGTGVKLSSSTATTGANGQASITVVPTATGTLTVKAAAAGVTATVSFTIAATSGTAAEPGVSQVITISEATSGATVYYTTNGTTPTTSSTKYTGPITLTGSETLKFIAVAPGYTNSAVRSVTDTVQ